MQELTGYFFEDLEVGMSAAFAKTVSEADIYGFAGITGDTNPVHINEEYARQTPFEGRIAHGMLSAGFISTVLGTKLPGPGSIYMMQTLKFKAPVRIGDTVVARATIREIVEGKPRVKIATVCTVGDTVVAEGEALIMVPQRNP